MKIAQNMLIGVWVLIILNFLMAFGSIWIFIRMTPAIEQIIHRNERSLEACQEMLASLAMNTCTATDSILHLEHFIASLNTVKNNITEAEEPYAFDSISAHFRHAFKGDENARNKTIASILWLGRINRTAMILADKRAQHIGNAGAWGIVFMAAGIFLATLLFLRKLNKDLIAPFEEINAVLTAHRQGDTMRRCIGNVRSKGVENVFRNLNAVLDKR